MDRRKSLKLIATGAIAVPTVIAACNTEEKKETQQNTEPVFNLDRNADELKHEKELLAKEKFFTADEMATITILADIIIPKDEVSGSASDAKVPDFIEFIVKDMPEHQIPLRGGLRWLDVESMKRFEKSFKDCSQQQQLEIVDDIAYPERKLKPGMSQGVKFFNLMRDLTATGFYTSEIGVKDIGYMGNKPNQWNGVPDDVLKQYGISYTEKEMKECVKF
jgi:gluconate 2-dehydrogenase gamma chain